MNKYTRFLSIIVACSLSHLYASESPKTIELGKELHKIIPHPKPKMTRNLPLTQRIEESVTTITDMQKSLKAVHELETKYKLLLTADAKKTLVEFKAMLNTSIKSHSSLLDSVKGYVEKVENAVSKLDEKAQELVFSEIC